MPTLSDDRPGATCLLSTAAVVLLMLTACASNNSESGSEPGAVHDPFEKLNRQVYAFNLAVDKVSTKPLAKGYRKVTPPAVRKGIANVFDNMTTPRSALNNFLQGKPARGFNELGRFLFNTTLGLGGIFNIAELGGMNRYDEDFAQTFAVWGLPEGPYLMLPIVGPHSLLAAIALPLDFYSDLQRYIDDASVRDRLYVLRIIDARQRLLAADSLLEDSSDKYISFRDAYLQNREYQIYDGDPPVDEVYYDFLDEEDL